MKGYKVFKPDWTCRGYQYKVGETFEEDVIPLCCIIGFHFCTDLVDCFKYYEFNPDNKVAEIEALGDIDSSVKVGDIPSSKHCTNKIKIVRELTWFEVLQLVNEGKGNTGYGNIGNYNSSHGNEGNGNSGNNNKGCYNSGNCNVGYSNSGYCNTGNANSGSWNIGHYNTGDWNKTNISNGYFNTIEDKILMFNKPSDWTHKDWCNSLAREILDTMPNAIYRWVDYYNMTEYEKKENPNCIKDGGCFAKVKDAIKENQDWWKSLMHEYRIIIKNLPNFDAAIFEEITGIKTD